MASNVIVTDPYPDEYFSLEQGEFSVTLETLQPGAEHRYNITVIPKVAGTFNTVPATIEYEYSDEDESVVSTSGFSSSLGRMQIVPATVFKRATASYVREWTTFGVMCCGSVLLPLAVWYALRNSNTKRYGAKNKALSVKAN